ncbi:MAG: epimerase [Gemmatimonadetes bacterium]|nr:epimerase [Gemmatimonadota bacterium]
MKVILFGASGMVGQGVLRECLADPDVERVLSVGRSASGQQDPKLREIVHPNLLELKSIEPDLTGHDACFYCLGISSAGMSEDRYTSITYDLTMVVAGTLLRLNRDMTFIYVSGMGTDSTERGRSMWARVKGRTENALLMHPFKAVYMFRPGAIIPMHGIKSKTGWYNLMYAAMTPLYPVLKQFFPGAVTTTEQVGRAMLHVAKQGYPKRILQSADISGI